MNISEIIAELIKLQPLFNLGVLGSVSDGKSTLVRTMSGIRTQKSKEEKKRNITINAGYANFKIYKLNEEYNDNNLNEYVLGIDLKEEEKRYYDLVNHLSFIDCPGHMGLILTMLSNIKLMNGVIIVVSASDNINEKPQLIQHLAAVKLSKIKNIIVCFNKIDLVNKDVAMRNYNNLKDLLDKYEIIPSNSHGIIPTSFSQNLGVDWVLEAITNLYNPLDIRLPNFKDESLEVEDQPYFLISRSFDVNIPGTDFNDIKGAVIGGTLIKGSLKIGDTIQIRPGKILGSGMYMPYSAKILSMESNGEEVEKIIPGGLIAIGTDLDPFWSKKNKLVGSILGKENYSPDVYKSGKFNYIKTPEFVTGPEWIPKIGNLINLQVETVALIDCEIVEISEEDNLITLNFSSLACLSEGMDIVLNQKIGDGYSSNYNIVAYGNFINGEKAEKIEGL